MDQQKKLATQRLLSDWKELQNNPIACVSAQPLEKDLFEWHCCFTGPEGSGWDNLVFHIILFFTPEYPACSPSAEFVPSFNFTQGTTMQGKKGVRICLSIFSDFAQLHSEWANEKGSGWSPSYTVSTVLLNVVSFLCNENVNSMKNNAQTAKNFVCECGHSQSKPFPPFPEITSKQIENSKEEKSLSPIQSTLTCYVTKIYYGQPETKEVFGFGIKIDKKNPRNASLTSPCEFITLTGFNQLAHSGKIVSVMKEELQQFLPLVLHPDHAGLIKSHFEKAISEITGERTFQPELVLKVLPKLINSTVVTFMNGTTHTSERALQGYFQFHSLFLWAIQTYPSLQKQIDNTIQTFLKDPAQRSKNNTPNVGEWLALLTVSPKYSWKDVSHAYLGETFLRNVMWYLKEDSRLADITCNNHRLSDTFRYTEVSRNLLAFQVNFLDAAKPSHLSLEDITKLYASTFGLPTKEMEERMKTSLQQIKQAKNYQDWFQLIKVPYPGEKELIDWLIRAVQEASQKDGYYDRNNRSSYSSTNSSHKRSSNSYDNRPNKYQRF